MRLRRGRWRGVRVLIIGRINERGGGGGEGGSFSAGMLSSHPVIIFTASFLKGDFFRVSTCLTGLCSARLACMQRRRPIMASDARYAVLLLPR